MGQYYEVVLIKSGIMTVYLPKINGESQGLKLMEHSWMENRFCKRIAEIIDHNPTRVAWVGDYAENDDYTGHECISKESFEAYLIGCQNKDSIDEVVKNLTDHNYNISGKVLVNHDRKLLLNLDDYRVKVRRHNLSKNEESAEWIPFPLSLLTAVGNGKGGGDYSGINEDSVGTWKFDELEIINFEELEKYYDEGYNDFYVIFSEE